MRRADSLSNTARRCGVAESRVAEIVDRFVEGGRYFIVRSPGASAHDVRIEISHESLIRQWPKLTRWTDAERDARDRLLGLIKAARSRALGRANWLTGAELETAWRWWLEFAPTPIWAERYADAADFQTAQRYLAESRRRSLRARALAWLLASLAVAALAVIAILDYQRRDAARQLALNQANAEVQALESKGALAAEQANEASNEAREKISLLQEQYALDKKLEELQTRLESERSAGKRAALEAERDAAERQKAEKQDLAQRSPWLVCLRARADRGCRAAGDR